METVMAPLPLTTPVDWTVICVMRLSHLKILWEDTELVCTRDVHAVAVIIQIQDPWTSTDASTNLQVIIQKWLHGDS